MNTPIFDNKFRPVNTVIIDDEAHIRETLRSFLSQHCPQVKIIGEAGSVDESEKIINRNQPDLILLDIELDGGTAFDLLNMFKSPWFKVIFITAYNEYAIKAFKVSAIDFLLKPVNPLELAEAIIRAQLMLQQEQLIKLAALKINLKSGLQGQKKIVIKTLESIHLLDISTISYCQSDTVYTTIYTTDNRSILSSKSIKDYEEMLTDFGFFRVHRSFLINISHVKRFEKREGGCVILTNDCQIPVASRKKEEMLALLNDL